MTVCHILDYGQYASNIFIQEVLHLLIKREVLNMYCTNCGQESSKKICTSCGIKQDKTHKYCKWCGNELSENATICTQCNKNIKPNKLLSFFRLVLEIVCSLLFFVFFITTFTDYFAKGAISGGILVLVLSFVGLLISLPFAFKIIERKIKINKIFPIRICSMVLFLVLLGAVALPIADEQVVQIGNENLYNSALAEMETNPTMAQQKFLTLGDYKDSTEKAKESNKFIYNKAKTLLEKDTIKSKDLEEIEILLNALPENFDDKLELKKEYKYQKGLYSYNNHFYSDSQDCFEEIKNYKDVKTLLKKPIFGLIGNYYSASNKVSLPQTYYLTKFFGFLDSPDKKFVASYKESAETITDILTEDYGLDDYNKEWTEFDCYEKDGKIYIGFGSDDDQLSNIKTKNGKVASFVWRKTVYKITNN